MEALSASSSIRSIGSRIVDVPRCALCADSHSMRFRSVRVFFLITNTAGSTRFWRGTPTLSAIVLLKSRCDVVNAAGPTPEVEAANANDGLARERLSHQIAGTVESDEALVDSSLSLVAQVVVNAGDDDDHLVAGVRGLADQSGIVGRLAGLDMTDHHAPSVPLSGSGRILEEPEYPVRHVIQRGKHM